MAGRGPAPKPADKRARTNKDPIPRRSVLPKQVEDHSELPEDLLPPGEHWHPATLRWWRRWVESELSDGLLEISWSELESTAVLHHEFMRKRTFTLASEMRIRMASFGATPQDQARLRISVSRGDPDEDGGEIPAAGSSSRARRGGLRAV